MKRGMRQSLLINNFFTLASIVIISITITLYSKYIVGDEKEEVTPLSCQSETFSTFKLFNQKLLNESQKALNEGYYKLQGGYIKSQYSKSIIEDFISLNEVNSYYEETIKTPAKKDINKYLTINYELIENDKKDPSKKLKDCKLCSGSIQTSFRAGNIEIFRYYTDFMIYDKNEIKSRIDCTIKVYKNHVKKLSN